MKTIVTIDQLNKISDYHIFDEYLLVCKKYSCFHYYSLSEEECLSSINKIHSLNKKVYILIDKVISEFEIDEISLFIDKLEKNDIDGYFFSDLGILQILKEKNLLKKGNYYSQTQIVSTLEMSVFNNYGLNSIFVSKDLNLNDYIEKGNIYPIGVVIYSYCNLFYSKRNLISSFKNHYNIVNFNEKDVYYIKEKKRTLLNKIFENENGTYIFTDYILNHLNEINLFKQKNIKYLLLDDNLIIRDDFNKIIDFFKNKKNFYELTDMEKDTYEK